MLIVSTMPPPLQNWPTLQSTGNKIGNSVNLLTFHSLPPSSLMVFHAPNNPSANASGNISGNEFATTLPISDEITVCTITSTRAATPVTPPAKTAIFPATISVRSRPCAALASRAQYGPKPHHRPTQPIGNTFTSTTPATPAKNRQQFRQQFRQIPVVRDYLSAGQRSSTPLALHESKTRK